MKVRWLSEIDSPESFINLLKHGKPIIKIERKKNRSDFRICFSMSIEFNDVKYLIATGSTNIIDIESLVLGLKVRAIVALSTFISKFNYMDVEELYEGLCVAFDKIRSLEPIVGLGGGKGGRKGVWKGGNRCRRN